MADKALKSLKLPGIDDTLINTPPSTATDFDVATAYAVGDIVFNNTKLYKFIVDHPAGAWNNAHVTETTVGGELSTIYQDISDLSGTVSGKYTKPSTGIPASDLASGVIPDVSGFYTKPSGGIPDSDLSSGVQTSLGKADTAYQKPSGGIPLTDLASNVQNVSGTTPSITGTSGMRYICGEVATLSITPPVSGIIDVIFTSGSTPTVLTVPNTVKFPEWFDPTSLVADTVYEINIADGVYGAVMSWT